MDADPLDRLRAGARDAGAVVAEFKAAWDHAGDDGALLVHVQRRRDDARGAGLRSLAGIEEACRLAVAKVRPQLEEEIRQREWIADDSRRDWDVRDGRRIPVVPQWSSIRRRIDEEREPEACIALLAKMAREFARAGDAEGLAILTHETPGYLVHYRRWPPGRAASAIAAIQDAERAWKDPPEYRLGSLESLRATIAAAIGDAREAIETYRRESP